jgi:cytochrome c553
VTLSRSIGRLSAGISDAARLRLSLGLTVVVAVFVIAAPSGAGNAAEAIRSVRTCVGCHGTTGEGNAAIGAPRLAGVGEAYLREQLHDFTDGWRQSPIMGPVARALDSEQQQAVSDYFSHLPAPDIQVAAQSSQGQRLAARGRWSDGLPACSQCHGPNGVGVGTAFPPLAGLPASYITTQLQAWQDGRRPPGPLGLMTAVAKKLSADDIQAAARYFAPRGTAPNREGGK